MPTKLKWCLHSSDLLETVIICLKSGKNKGVVVLNHKKLGSVIKLQLNKNHYNPKLWHNFGM